MVGNIPNFTKIDILRCFLRFEKNLGRQELAKDLDLGEGTIRTILEMLKSKNLLGSAKKGHFLNKKGEEELKNILEYICPPVLINTKIIYPEYKKIGILVKNADVKSSYKLRDLAVKNGADGALILKFHDKLFAPESDFEQSYKELEDYFDFKNNDLLAVAFSNEKRKAESGSLAIAIELCPHLKSFINGF